MESRWREFFEAVCDMRHEQKEYFRTRSLASLSKARAAEKKVDELCAALRHGQGTLFE